MLSEYKNLFFIYSIGISFIFLISLTTYIFLNKNYSILNKKITIYIFSSSFIFYILSISSLTFYKINALHHYVDFATHLEILWRNSQGYGLTTLMSEEYHGGSHWFAAHFTPIVFLTYAPFFKIFPFPYTLQIVETIFLSSSLIPLWLISKKYFNENLSRIFISSFLFFPTIFYINLYGVAYLELCIPFLLFLFYFFEEKKNTMFFLFLILCLMIREEVALVTSFFGIYIIFKKRYLLGTTTLITSLIYFYIVIFIIMPSFRDGNETLLASVLYQHLEMYSEILINILINPLDTLDKIFNAPRIGSFVMFLIPLMFTPLFEITVFLISIPNLMMTFLSQSITHSNFILYYLSPSIPVFFYAGILGIYRISKWKPVNKSALISSVLAASIMSTIFFGATPISIAFWNQKYTVGNFYTTNFHRTAYFEEERDTVAKKIAKLVPDNAVVSAEQHLLPLLFKKKKMVIFPSSDEEIKYVLIDRFNPKKTGGPEENVLRSNPELEYSKFLKSSEWKVIKEEKGIILFKKIK